VKDHDWGSLDLTAWEANFQRLTDLGDEVAKTRARFENLKNVEKAILATQAKQSKETSAAAKNFDAYASEAYKQWCDEVKEAEHIYIYNKLRYEAGRLWFEMVRTAEATKRTEMKLV
jgi:mevalonate pyrophosphate decarboxylase